MSTSRRNCTTGLPQAATKIISFSGAPPAPKPKNNPIQQQPLAHKPNAPIHSYNTSNGSKNNSNHKHSNTQPMMRDVLMNNNIFAGNPQSTPASPTALQQRYNRSDTLSSNYSTAKDKPLPSRPSSRPLTPITYNYDFFSANNNQNNSNRHSNNTITHRKAPPKHTKNSQSETMRTMNRNFTNNAPHMYSNTRIKPAPPSPSTRRRHQGTVIAKPKDNWQLKYEKLKEQYNKLELEQKDLKQTHGALTRQYRILEKNYNNKCIECAELIDEKKELNRNLTEVARRDSIAKSDKSDNISLSGDFSDNKSDYSAIGVSANLVHQLIASPSQSALSSIPPYNPNMNNKSRSNNKQNHINKYGRKLGGKLMGPPMGVFSDDGTESETSMIGSHTKYNKHNIINRNRYNNNRIMNGSISSLESENTNNQFAINGSQKFSMNSNTKTNVNSYKSSDQYDDEQNFDPYANFTAVL